MIEYISMIKKSKCSVCKKRPREVNGYCKPCKNAYYKQQRKDNPEPFRAYNSKSKNKRRAVIYKAKSKPCADCGLTYLPCQMQFDHTNPANKVATVNQLYQSSAISEVLKEIKKCEVVCANCHALRTYLRQSRRKDTKVYT